MKYFCPFRWPFFTFKSLTPVKTDEPLKRSLPLVNCCLDVLRSSFNAAFCSSCALLCVLQTLHCSNTCKPQLATKSISPNLCSANQKAVIGGYPNYLDRSKNSQQDSPTLVANQSSKVSLKWPLLSLLSFRMIIKWHPFIFQYVTVQFLLDFGTKNVLLDPIEYMLIFRCPSISWISVGD